MKGAIAFLLVVLLLAGMAYVIFAYQSTGELPHIPYVNPESDVPANQPTTETTGSGGRILPLNSDDLANGVISKIEYVDENYIEYTNFIGQTWRTPAYGNKSTGEPPPESMTEGGGSENTWYPPNIPQTPQPVNIYNTDWIRDWLNNLRAP